MELLVFLRSSIAFALMSSKIWYNFKKNNITSSLVITTDFQISIGLLSKKLCPVSVAAPKELYALLFCRDADAICVIDIQQR